MTREEFIQYWRQQWLIYGKLPPMEAMPRKCGKSRLAEEITGESIIGRARTNVSRLVTAETSKTE